MNLRRIETLASIWIIDEGASRLLRLPRSEAPVHDTEIAYTGEWFDYDKIIEFGSCVGFTHSETKMRFTGSILSDSQKKGATDEQGK